MVLVVYCCGAGCLLCVVQELACLYEFWVDICCVFVIGSHVLRLIPWKFYIVVSMWQGCDPWPGNDVQW